jgi:uncharacterized membrane protein
VKLRILLTLMVVMIGLNTQRAVAGFRVCNQFEQTLSVAFGFLDHTRGWAAQGWWIIKPGDCAVVHGEDLDNRYYYVFAHPTDGGPPWKGGKAGFCIQKDKFLLYQAQFGKNTPEDCAAAGLQWGAFISADVGVGEKNHLFNFSGGNPGAVAPPPYPGPGAVAPPPMPPSPGPGGAGGTSCQRYPNLC